jgi:hypothetical protein
MCTYVYTHLHTCICIYICVCVCVCVCVVVFFFIPNRRLCVSFWDWKISSYTGFLLFASSYQLVFNSLYHILYTTCTLLIVFCKTVTDRRFDIFVLWKFFTVNLTLYVLYIIHIYYFLPINMPTSSAEKRIRKTQCLSLNYRLPLRKGPTTVGSSFLLSTWRWTHLSPEHNAFLAWEVVKCPKYLLRTYTGGGGGAGVA